ncbi:hypothetical protein C8F01DRAFT_1247541 [Mycena amicta]|nr:hypothetical protein C8F01DRAFT_1247541 [Mycena amicta]
MPSSDVSLALFAALPTKADKIDDFKGIPARAAARWRASFAGHVNGALNEHAPSFLTSSPPNVEKAVVIANKVDASKGKGVKWTPCREFLAGAIPIVEGEDFTPVFYVLELPGAKFHAAGNVVGALKEHASGLLASAPEMVKVDVIAASVRL